MAKLILFCTMFLVCLGAYGGESDFPTSLTLVDGTAYEGVKLISKTPAEVVFKHSKGVKNAKISDLSEELQIFLNYSETAAREVEAKQAEKTALRLKAIADEAQVREAAKILAEKKTHVFMIRGYVHRVMDDGIVVQTGVPTDLIYNRIRVSEEEVSKRKYKSYPVARPTRVFGFVYIEGHPRFAEFTDGATIDVNVYRDGIFRSGEETMKKFVYLQDF